MSRPAPCHPSATFANCCQPLHDGTPAATAEELMRSRYSAYVLGLRDYLAATWHPSTRPDPFELDDTPGLRWLGLEIRRHAGNGDDPAVVECGARPQPGGAPGVTLPGLTAVDDVDGP